MTFFCLFDSLLVNLVYYNLFHSVNSMISNKFESWKNKCGSLDKRIGVLDQLGHIPTSFIEAASTAANTLKTEILNIGGFLVESNNEVVVR